MAARIATALAQARCLEAVSESWRLDGELLLAHTLERPREWLLAHNEVVLSAAQASRYQGLLNRRQRGEPVAYLVGHKAFWDVDLLVTPLVLIPRPETELLVESVLERFAGRRDEPLQIADLGTGSGAIAIALARECPAWRITAVDISFAALAIARRNVLRLELDNIELHQGSWCAGLPRRDYDAVVANPPYVAVGDDYLSTGGLQFEPRLALESGRDGLRDIEEIISQSPASLKEDAWLFFEHGYGQRDAVCKRLSDRGFRDLCCARDLAGHDRVVAGRWPGRVDSGGSR